MGKFSRWLHQYTNLQRQEGAWLVRMNLYTRRALLIAIGSNVAVFIGVVVVALSNNYNYGALALVSSAILLYPLALRVAARFNNLAPLHSGAVFNWERYLSDVYHKRILEIEGINLHTTDGEKLKIEEYKNYLKQLEFVQSRILVKSPTPQSAVEVRAIINETEFINVHVQKLASALISDEYVPDQDKLHVIESNLLRGEVG